MPQPKRPASKPAPKKPPKKAAKRKPGKKPAAKRPPEPKVQVNRVNETLTAPPSEPQSPNDLREEQGLNPVEETQEERDAAGLAIREKAMTAGKPDPPLAYEPTRQELEHKDFDHHAAEERRQAELQAQRDEHNERTGDASLPESDW